MNPRIALASTLLGVLSWIAPPSDAIACDTAEHPPYPWLGSAPEPKVPMRLEGVCPFECCSYGEWVTSEETRVYADPHDKRRVLDRLPPKTKFVGLDGFIELERLGSARAAKAVNLRPVNGDAAAVTLSPEAQVVVLDTIGEGVWRIWYAGNVYQLPIYDSGLASETWFQNDPEAGLVFVDVPLGTWWARIRLPDGREGWLDMDDTPHLNEVDGCG